jgi:hypothetical protein
MSHTPFRLPSSSTPTKLTRTTHDQSSVPNEHRLFVIYHQPQFLLTVHFDLKREKLFIYESVKDDLLNSKIKFLSPIFPESSNINGIITYSPGRALDVDVFQGKLYFLRREQGFGSVRTFLYSVDFFNEKIKKIPIDLYIHKSWFFKGCLYFVDASEIAYKFDPHAFWSLKKIGNDIVDIFIHKGEVVFCKKESRFYYDPGKWVLFGDKLEPTNISLPESSVSSKHFHVTQIAQLADSSNEVDIFEETIYFHKNKDVIDKDVIDYDSEGKKWRLQAPVGFFENIETLCFMLSINGELLSLLTISNQGEIDFPSCEGLTISSDKESADYVGAAPFQTPTKSFNPLTFKAGQTPTTRFYGSPSSSESPFPSLSPLAINSPLALQPSPQKFYIPSYKKLYSEYHYDSPDKFKVTCVSFEKIATQIIICHNRRNGFLSLYADKQIMFSHYKPNCIGAIFIYVVDCVVDYDFFGGNLYWLEKKSTSGGYNLKRWAFTNNTLFSIEFNQGDIQKIIFLPEATYFLTVCPDNIFSWPYGGLVLPLSAVYVMKNPKISKLLDVPISPFEKETFEQYYYNIFGVQSFKTVFYEKEDNEKDIYCAVENTFADRILHLSIKGEVGLAAFTKLKSEMTSPLKRKRESTDSAISPLKTPARPTRLVATVCTQTSPNEPRTPRTTKLVSSATPSTKNKRLPLTALELQNIRPFTIFQDD